MKKTGSVLFPSILGSDNHISHIIEDLEEMVYGTDPLEPGEKAYLAQALRGARIIQDELALVEPVDPTEEDRAFYKEIENTDFRKAFEIVDRKMLGKLRPPKGFH